MSRGTTPGVETRISVLQWAVEREAAVTASLQHEGTWVVFKSRFLRHDPAAAIVQIAAPIGGDGPAIEIVAGQKLGLAFRRGHKKCLFTTVVVVRRNDTTSDGQPVDTIVLRSPDHVRELQRRAYQRTTVPDSRFIAVKVWEGGAPTPEEPSWPICSGRVGNASVGGILVDIRSDQNPRLNIGDVVGVEITASPGRPPLIADAQYRHCAVTSPQRLGLGFQFVGLEHGLPGRSEIQELAEFIRDLKRETARRERSRSPHS